MQTISKLIRRIFLTLLICASLGTLFISNIKVFAADQEYQLLAPIPLMGADGRPTEKISLDSANPESILKTYIPGVIKLTIALAGALAVLMIVIGGFQYITTASGVVKASTKGTITNALTGLMLAIGAWVILNTLNPNLVKFDLSSLTPVEQSPSAASGNNIVPTEGSPTSGTNPTNQPCPNCTLMPVTIPAKRATEKGCALPGPCMLNATLINKLQRMTNNMPSFVTWRVTEMYPPTVPHLSSCHDAGTCADTSLDNATNDDTLLAFLKAADTAGFSSYVYEACNTPHKGFTTNRLTELTTNKLFKNYWGRFQCFETTTAENMHVNM